MKKVLSIVLSIAMVLCMMPAMAFAGTATASQAAAAYSDTEGTPCEGAVNVLHALGVVDGYTDGTYKPEQVVTRAEMAKLIITALGLSDYASATTSKFTDMGAASWAIPYVEYAANLNIVNGYGYGLFGPNDTVTYEQAVTMIVRALGYTDECKEMNGSWPAIYVQKATALGLFEDVVNGGSKGADRGDVAIMLYNALDVAQVYATDEGETKAKTGADGGTINMMTTLNKSGDSYYKVVTSQDADTALQDIRSYIGAAAKVTVDKNNDVLAVGDVKTTSMTGEVTSDNKFKVNGVEYTLSGVKYVDVNSTTGGIVEAGTNDLADTITNGETTSTTCAALSAAKDVTITARVSGTTIKEIYSIATWSVTNEDKVDESDIAQIERNKKLLGKEFAKDDNGDIDTTTFVLEGVSSLSDIEKDDVVYVYINSTSQKISKVAVGQKTISGEITKKTGSKVTIDGTAYEFAAGNGGVVGKTSISSWSAGDKITAYLDAYGRIYDADIEEGSVGNFALVTAFSGTPSKLATDSDAKIQLVGANGVANVYAINGEKYVKSVDEYKSSSTSAIQSTTAAPVIVKFSVNESNAVTKINNAGSPASASAIKTTLSSITKGSITKAGYLEGVAIAENAVIFTAPYTTAGGFDLGDTDDIAVVAKADVLDTDVDACVAIYDNDTKKIVAMLISDSTTADEVYGVVTSSFDLSDSDGADFYIKGEKLTSQETEDKYSVSGDKNNLKTTLYEIKKTAANKYKMTSATSKLVATSTAILVSSTAAVTAPGDAIGTSAAIKYDNGYVEDAGGSTLVKASGWSNLSLYSDVTIYIYDLSKDAWELGSKSDLTDDDLMQIAFYSTGGSDDDSYKLIDYVVAYRK